MRDPRDEGGAEIGGSRFAAIILPDDVAAEQSHREREHQPRCIERDPQLRRVALTVKLDAEETVDRGGDHDGGEEDPHSHSISADSHDSQMIVILWLPLIRLMKS